MSSQNHSSSRTPDTKVLSRYKKDIPQRGISRRSLLLGSAAGLTTLIVGQHFFRTAFSGTMLSGQFSGTDELNAGKRANDVASSFFTAYKEDNKHFIASLNLDGEQRFISQIPRDCHSIVSHKGLSNSVIAISRDPDAAALRLDSHSGKIIQHYQPAEGRHFNGHGACSADGRLFFASQNDFLQQRVNQNVNKNGVIGIYRTDTGEQIKEISSHGIGPHEIALLSDNRTLVIANGGIQTHPSTGRKDLNLPTMHPTLSYVDVNTGDLLQRFDLPQRKSSIRHLAVASDDTVVIGMQYKGKRDVPPVVGFQKGSQGIQLAKADSDQIHWKMNQYTASLCVHPETGVTAITCPRGNILTFWDANEMKYLSAIEMDDPSGVSLSEDGKTFLITSATGYLYHVDAQTQHLSKPQNNFWQGAHWGNHLS